MSFVENLRMLTGRRLSALEQQCADNNETVRGKHVWREYRRNEDRTITVKHSWFVEGEPLIGSQKMLYEVYNVTKTYTPDGLLRSQETLGMTPKFRVNPGTRKLYDPPGSFFAARAERY